MSPQNPLERAIHELEEKIKLIGGSQDIGYALRKCSHYNYMGLGEALSICQRILDEEKPSEPAPKRWEIVCSTSFAGNSFAGEKIKAFLNDGFEPFAVDHGVIYFKRLVPCEKE